MVVDPQGVVIEKSFHDDHGLIDSDANILQEKFQVDPAGRPKHILENDDLKATAYISSATIRRGQIQTVSIDIEIKEGRHVYAPSVKGGYTSTALTFDLIKDVHIGETSFPTSTKKKLLGKNVPIFENTLTLKTSIRNQHRDDFTVRAQLDYQSCDDKECYMPQQLTFELPLIYLDNI